MWRHICHTYEAVRPPGGEWIWVGADVIGLGRLDTGRLPFRTCHGLEPAEHQPVGRAGAALRRPCHRQ
ncbi:MAG: hypothetical protein M0Z42_05150 [Actinomycetota bacterium]|nr:hypothetical protein [Actinomycetota bacterium]